VNLFILGLIVPSNSTVLLGSSGANTKASPFVLAIELAGVHGLPSVFNAVITISVISVANSATYASTRTIQALAMKDMAPKFLAYVDKRGRPIPTIILQLLLGLLAFANEGSVGTPLFTWLLALSGVANFFVYGSICLARIRIRKAWRVKGHTIDELPYRARFGIWGSWLGVFLNLICLAAQFYVALWPVGGSPNAMNFFESYLAASVIIFLYLLWKVYSWFKHPSHRPLFVRTRDIDIYTGMREGQLARISGENVTEGERRASILELQAEKKKGAKGRAIGVVRGLF
jgi:amino acid transporter